MDKSHDFKSALFRFNMWVVRAKLKQNRGELNGNELALYEVKDTVRAAIEAQIEAPTDAVVERCFELLDRIDIQCRAVGHPVSGIGEIKAIIRAATKAEAPKDDEVWEAAKQLEHFIIDLQFDGDKRQVSDDVDTIIRAATTKPVMNFPCCRTLEAMGLSWEDNEQHRTPEHEPWPVLTSKDDKGLFLTHAKAETVLKNVVPAAQLVERARCENKPAMAVQGEVAERIYARVCDIQSLTNEIEEKLSEPDVVFDALEDIKQALLTGSAGEKDGGGV